MVKNTGLNDNKKENVHVATRCEIVVLFEISVAIRRDLDFTPGEQLLFVFIVGKKRFYRGVDAVERLSRLRRRTRRTREQNKSVQFVLFTRQNDFGQ